MYIKMRKKHIGICLLVCCLFLTGYLSILNTGNIFADNNVFASSSIGGGSQHTSMDGTADSGHFDYLSATDTAICYPAFSIQQSRSQVTKIKSNLLTTIITALLICFVYSSRLCARVCTPFNSLRITVFLHKKDGMK